MSVTPGSTASYMSSGTGAVSTPTNVDPQAVALDWRSDTGILRAMVSGTQTPVGTIPVVQTYSPVLHGASDDPTVTYTTQIGRYYVIGKLCYISITVVTSTMTKSTLTDNLRVSLPVAAANISSMVQHLAARVENATAVKVADLAETVADQSYLHFREVSTGAASAIMTYGVTDIGVLTNTISIIASGVYESV